MKTTLKSLFVSLIVGSSILPREALSQQKAEVTEPPIPVYIVCPYHEDSLRRAGVLPQQGVLSTTPGKIDSQLATVQHSVDDLDQTVSMELKWLSPILLLIAILNLLTLRAVFRLGKEIRQGSEPKVPFPVDSTASAAPSQTEQQKQRRPRLARRVAAKRTSTSRTKRR